MELFLFCVFTLIVHVSGQQSLMKVLSSNLDLSTLYQHVNASANLTSFFSSLNRVTLLAPSNAAFSNLLASRSGEALSDAELLELLQYHVLDGNFTKKSWSSTPQFVPTFLKDRKYTNVTGGQVVELVSDGQGNPQIFSWNKTVSTIITPDISCTNGMIHIVSDTLNVPLDMGTLLLTAQSKFNYFVAGLYEVGITSTASFDPVADQVNATDVTFFVPNSAVALETFTNITSNASNEANVLDILKYHIVVNDLVYSTGFKDGMQLTASTGKNISITVQNGNILVNQAEITTPDYIVSNGVVHIINGLLDDLFDEKETPTPTPTPSSPSTPSPSNVLHASKGLSSGAKAAIGVVISLLAIAAIVGGLLWYIKFRRRPTPSSPEAALTSSGNPPERKRSYVHHDDLRGNKVNRLLGQDLQLDPPLLSNDKFIKAQTAELDATPMVMMPVKSPLVKSPSIGDNTTIHEFPANKEVRAKTIDP